MISIVLPCLLINVKVDATPLEHDFASRHLKDHVLDCSLLAAFSLAETFLGRWVSGELLVVWVFELFLDVGENHMLGATHELGFLEDIEGILVRLIVVTQTLV